MPSSSRSSAYNSAYNDYHQISSRTGGQPGAASSPASSSPSMSTYQQFVEPSRYTDKPDIHEPKPVLCFSGLILRVFFRIRNSLAVYNFFFLHCLNALLNIEIYREYMAAHSSAKQGENGSVLQDMEHRTWWENLYIITLSAPLFDVLARLYARNYLKLNLAKAQSSIGLASSLAICTPSLNTYALLILRHNSFVIPFVMLFDLLEIGYSFLMFLGRTEDTGALWIKLGFLLITSIFWIWDVVTLVQERRFFGKLPRTIHPIFVCWDINRRFHWHSANSVFDIMEEHEHADSDVFTSDESKRVRRRIAEWNEDEDEVLKLEQYRSRQHSRQEPDDAHSDGEPHEGAPLLR